MGHLNLVDLGAGGYRTIEPGTRPLACADIRVGDRVEVDGREHYRDGKVLAIGPYEREIDTIFLAEGLDNLGLTLCTTPDCDLTPESAVQPES